LCGFGNRTILLNDDRPGTIKPACISEAKLPGRLTVGHRVRQAVEYRELC
jgi:hypothetical protein